MAKPWREPQQLERRTRTLPPTNASAEFILKSVSLAERSQYVAELDKFVPLQEAQQHEETILALWEDSIVEKEKLFAAMELLGKKSRSKEVLKTDTPTELRQFTWGQVISEVQSAGDSYRNDGGKVKKIFRGMCDNSKMFENWLCLLPNGDYGASITGGFFMIVQAARSLNDVQTSIYETLASIPDALAHAHAYVEIYRAHSSMSLVRKTAALFKCIMITLQLIIQFLLKGSFKRGATAVLKGNAYEKELMGSIQDMKSKVLDLREEANLCLQKRIAEMDNKSDMRAFREQTRQELAKEELLLAIDSSTEVTAQKVCTYLLRQLQASPGFDVRTGGVNLPFKTPLQITDQETLQLETVAPKREGPTSIDLLKMLEYDDSTHKQDIEDSLALGYTQSDAAQARATWVLYSTEMGEFLAGKAESKLLLVNGNCDATEFISPLSFVCAKISDLVSVSKQVMSITYFCGRHSDELREPKANAVGMLASLVGQLLMQVKRWKNTEFSLDLSTVSDDDCRAIQEEDLSALFDIFRAIVMQLPKGTIIFCLVDSLSAYENSDRRENTIAVMRKLARLVKKSTGAMLKLLVTCPGRSMDTDRWITFNSRKAKMLHVPEDL